MPSASKNASVDCSLKKVLDKIMFLALIDKEVLGEGADTKLKIMELLLKGPESFPLERLLAIFQCITLVDEVVHEQESPEDGFAMENGDNGSLSDVLLQLLTLCHSNFLSRSASCPLEGVMRYRSTIDEEMALKVARIVNFPLSKCL